MKYKITFLLLSLCPLSALASQSYLCKTSDFDPTEYTGESLVVTMTGDRLSEIRVSEGSWDIDGKDSDPKVSLENGKETVYSCTFGDGACKLAVTNPFDPAKAMRFEFVVTEVGSSTFYLHCSEQ